MMRKRIDIQVIFLCLLLTVTTGYSQDKLYTNQFPLSDVELLDGPFKHARNLNIDVLLKYDVDRLMAGYRKEAGLLAKAQTFPNWDGLDGHIVGHYLSALAMNYASTGNTECKKRMEYILAELKECQKANATKYPDWAVGYAGAVPNSAGLWPKIKAGDVSLIWKYWVPWYNVHKMYAGLRDAWLYAGNEDAKKLFLSFCDWAITVTALLSDAKMEEMLGNEHGGMNEIFADAFQITGEEKYLIAAKRFSHKQILEPLSLNKDQLDNKHANTQVPKAIGYQRIGELSYESKYANAGRFFWETVTGNRTLAFGGNNRREFFPSVAASSDFINDVEGPESCNSYNMLKLTQDLFRMNPLGKYMDYYERTLYNHILSTQHPEHGGYVYFTPARPLHYRVYSSPNAAMWCCVGSGMENHGKYNELIYTHQKDSLFVNLFIASTLNWKEKGVELKQETSFPYEEQTKIYITQGATSFKLFIRYPSWVKKNEVKVTINGKAYPFTVNASSYIMITRDWKKNDVVLVKLPMQNRTEQMPNVPEYIAIMHGPLLLAAKTGADDLKGLIANDSRWGHIAGGKKLPVDKAPIIIADNMADIANALVPVKNKPLHFTVPGLQLKNPINIELQPFYQLHDARYMMYWMALSTNQYAAYVDSVALIEKQRLALEKRTVDFVAPGEQQPEADHFIQKQNSNTGNYLDEFWRDARNEGFFSYRLSTNNETGLSLVVRYWGNETGNRKFDIYIDDAKLVTEDISNKWKQQQFKDVEYAIPDDLIKGKSTVRIKFQPHAGNTAGAVYYLRMTRK